MIGFILFYLPNWKIPNVGHIFIITIICIFDFKKQTTHIASTGFSGPNPLQNIPPPGVFIPPVNDVTEPKTSPLELPEPDGQLLFKYVLSFIFLIR